MIEKMKKIGIMFTAHDAHEYLHKVQELGVVDIAHTDIDDTSNEVLKNYSNLNKALDVLEKNKDQEELLKTEHKTRVDVHEIVDDVLLCSDTQDKLRTEHEHLSQMLARVEIFGNLSSVDLDILQDYAMQCSIYTLPVSAKKTLMKHVNDDEEYIRVLFIKNDYYYFVHITQKDSTFAVPDQWEEYELSEHRPSELKNKIRVITNDMEAYHTKISSNLRYMNDLLSYKIELENELSVKAVHSQSEHYDKILYVEGFAPVSTMEQLQDFCREQKLGLTVQDTKEDDDVPTKQKNLAPVRMMKPLFKLMDTVPGYKEFDISGIFLLALTLFFGMIIGDAGYGVVLLIGTALVSVFAKKKTELFTLTLYFMMWNSLATIAWGGITGNWFGNGFLAQNTFLSYLVIDSFAIYNPESSLTIWHFAFTVGLIHLCVAHLWGIIRGIRSKDYFLSISHLGSGVMIYGLYFLVLSLLLGSEQYPMPPYALFCILGGFVTVVISADQGSGRNFFVGVGIGLAKIFLHALNSLGNFADIISYIRLFAVGLASLSIANAFNGMAQGIMSSGSVLSIVLGILVLLLAHTFNLTMSLLAIIIHGVRLNILEFGMHIGMEWSGRLYTPFRKKNKIMEETNG